jgi:signal transduction histidine kinase
VETLREKWDEEGCQLTVDLPEDLPEVQGDEQAVVTVLRNLLENAWKYSGEQKEISVRGRSADGGVWLEVADNGVGLEPVDQERIFRQFYRVDQRLSREQGGLGLGLAIVKRLMTSMEGRVEVESERGKGSVFKIWLRRVS